MKSCIARWTRQVWALSLLALWAGSTRLPAEDATIRQDGLQWKLVDIYHYLESQGVVGRWVHVYRPLVTGDDPTMYFQRLSRDGRRGIVIPKKPAPGPATIKPKGLQATETYLVSFHESASSESRTGADLMARGVRLEKMPPGELIYLNLPLHPGSKLDTEPPSPPSQATQSRQENMGYPGVELSWKAGSDNNWVFYYSADDIWGVCIYRQKLATAGRHHLRLEVLDEHNPQAKGGVVHLDGVRIEPE